MSTAELIILEVAEARYLTACGWTPEPKPKGAENDLSVPQWWTDPRGEDGYKSFRQDSAVNIQRERDAW